MPTVSRDKPRCSAAQQLLLCALIATLLVAGCFVFSLAVAREAPPGLSGLDLVWYFVPTFGHIKVSLAAGEFPLWNSWQLAGMPFVATAQPAVFYPTTLPLAVLFEPALAVTLQCALAVVLAGVLSFGCARALGAGALAAAITALAYAASGPLLGEIFNPVMVVTRAWLPGVLWLIVALVRRPGPGTAAGLALAIGCAFTGGHPQGFLYIIYSASVFGLFALVWNPAERSRSRIVGFALLAAGLAAGLMAVQLLPTLELAGLAFRSVTGAARGWALLGTRDTSSLAHAVLAGEGDVGVIVVAIPLAVLALISSRSRVPALFFVLLALLVLDFLRGDAGFSFAIAERYLGAANFRYASRMAFVFQFCAAILLGFGCDALASAIRSRRPQLATVVLTAGLVCVGAERISANLPEAEFLPASRPEQIDGPPELVKFADEVSSEGRLLLEGKTSGWRVSRNLGQRHGIPIANAYDPFIPQNYADFFATADLSRWFGNVGAQVPGLEPFRDPALSQDRRILDLLSVRWVTIIDRYPATADYNDPREAALADGNLAGELVGDLIVHEREAARPRAFVVGRVVEVADAEAAISKVRSFAFDPATEAVVWRPGDLEPQLFAGLDDGSPVGSVTAFGNTTNTVTVRAHCTRRCLLVITDLFFPGWKARVGDEKLRIVSVNGIFRGVILEAGDHDVRMSYEPASVRAGAAVSLGSLLLLVGCFAQARRNRRRL